MTRAATSHMTLTELSAELSKALSQIEVGSLSGRVRDVPNGRTIRYYTTLGLVDRPLEYRGRTAIYGRRHLLQLVAIKRFQARGLSLSQIQEKLLSIPDDALADLAQLPEAFTGEHTHDDDAHDHTTSLEAAAPSRRDTDFWSALPAPVEREEHDKKEPPKPHTPAAVDHLDILQGVRLTPEVALLLGPTKRPLDKSDIQAIQAAAAPLLQVLVARRLLDRS